MEFNLEQILESKNLNELRADENYVMMTPLIKFTMKNDINAVVQLLKAGANPNISDDWGTTPLEIACFTWKYRIIKNIITIFSKS